MQEASAKCTHKRSVPKFTSMSFSCWLQRSSHRSNALSSAASRSRHLLSLLSASFLQQHKRAGGQRNWDPTWRKESAYHAAPFLLPWRLMALHMRLSSLLGRKRHRIQDERNQEHPGLRRPQPRQYQNRPSLLALASRTLLAHHRIAQVHASFSYHHWLHSPQSRAEGECEPWQRRRATPDNKPKEIQICYLQFKNACAPQLHGNLAPTLP